MHPVLLHRIPEDQKPEVANVLALLAYSRVLYIKSKLYIYKYFLFLFNLHCRLLPLAHGVGGLEVTNVQHGLTVEGLIQGSERCS